jgi:cell division protein FtsQ
MSIALKNIPWKKRSIQAVWILLGMGTMVLFGAAIQKKNLKNCTGIQIEINGPSQLVFLDEKEILNLLNKSEKIKGVPTSKINLRFLESSLEKNSWIRKAEMYFDNNQQLQVRVLEREPLARVFVLGGSSFYVDSDAVRLPLSDKLTARVTVFTNFPSNKTPLAKPDSSLLQSIVKMAAFIQADSFWMAQVSSVEINPQTKFEIVPLIGEHKIIVGDATQLDKKFGKLKTFYRQALMQQGLNTYEKLDLRFDNQIVAVYRGAEKAFQDSAAAKAILAANASGTIGLQDTISTKNIKLEQALNNNNINKPLTNRRVLHSPKSVH